MINKYNHHLPTLCTVILLFIFAQLTFFSVHAYLSLEEITRTAFRFPPLLLSKALFLPLCHFLLSQMLIYGLFLYFLWYLSINLSELFALTARGQKLLNITLSLLSIITILVANAYYASHSFFAILIRHHLFQDQLSNHSYKLLSLVAGGCLGLAGLLSLLRLVQAWKQGQNRLRHAIFLSLLVFIFLSAQLPTLPSSQHYRSAATAAKPNIFIVGLDAVRPDYLGFFNPTTASPTPHLDQFLQSAMTFAEVYTPLGRTFPAWASILSGQYPRHHGIIEDSIDTSQMNLSATLPQILQKAGYETVYASDDHRFSNLNQQFGFQQIIGPDGTLADFLIGNLNDFPLSNLLIPTVWGQILFPYNYANHGSYHSYQWQNFLNLLQQQLPQNLDKPLFLAVHFNQTAWPFYWFNDQQDNKLISAARYPKAIKAADLMLSQFLALLQKHGLLQYAVVILLSDHGMTLALPGDRVISEQHYQGDKTQIKLRRIPYAQTQQMALDTSYGYGSDVLSLKQYRSLLAIKEYGLQWGKPRLIQGRVSHIDLAPTLLDLLKLPILQRVDGFSLKPYLQSSRAIPKRPLFLESGYSVPEMQHDGILIESVLKESIAFFQIDPNNGRVTVSPQAIKLLIQNYKQFAVLDGDWLLASYPASLRYKIVRDQTGYRFKSYIAKAFWVLVNLKNGQWTVELNSLFAKQAPFESLHAKLEHFSQLSIK